MKPLFAVLVLYACIAFAALSQTNTPPPQQALSQLRLFLGLTDTQVSAILQSNSDYNAFSFQQQRQIQNAQIQISVETAKDPLDPMAIGTLYAGIENACRDLRDKAATSQKQNLSILTDAQKAKLNVLTDAMKLAPIISEAQSGNLLGSTNSPLAVSGFSSVLLGAIPFASLPGCGGNGILSGSVRFTSTPPVDGNATQPNVSFGALHDPANGIFVGNGNPRLLPSPNPWFNRTQLQ